jgi:DNA-binding NarL/FixJ family response regulator
MDATTEQGFRGGSDELVGRHAYAGARMIRLLVADRAPTRLGIRMSLGEGVEICAEAATATQAIRAAKREQPDVCLIARELDGDGIVAVRAIARAAPSSTIVVMADASDADQMLEAIHAGAMGYLPGGISPERLNKVLHAVDAQEAVLPRSLVTALLLELRAAGGESAGLTSREAQVLGMVRRGHSTAAIANKLGITPVTVRRHISGLVTKLGVVDRSELLANVPESDSQEPR